MQKVFYSTSEAAQLLNVTKRTVEKLCREGKIKAIKPAKKWLISKENLFAYLEKTTDYA